MTRMMQTIVEERSRIEAFRDEGTFCACCDQFVKLYKRTIHSTMARQLIAIYRESGDKTPWLHIPTILPTSRGGDVAKLRFWGLVEPMLAERDDGSSRVGYLRITEYGKRFVRSEAAVRKYALVYNQSCIGLEGEAVSIFDCLGVKFNYDDLMAGI